MMKNRQHIKWGFLFFFLPVVLWLFLLIVLPHIELLRLSFTKANTGKFTLDNYMAFFKEPIYWLTFVRTAGYSIIVTFLVMVISLPVSFYISKIVKERMTGVLMILILVPFWVSELIRVYGWMILLRESGVLNQFFVSIGLFKEPVEMLYNDITLIMDGISSMLFMGPRHRGYG
jgi:spermidine/putrescine transport system permease protein